MRVRVGSRHAQSSSNRHEHTSTHIRTHLFVPTHARTSRSKRKGPEKLMRTDSFLLRRQAWSGKRGQAGQSKGGGVWYRLRQGEQAGGSGMALQALHAAWQAAVMPTAHHSRMASSPALYTQGPRR